MPKIQMPNNPPPSITNVLIDNMPKAFQSVCDIDVNGDGIKDLVAYKPVTIVVKIPSSPNYATITFDGQTLAYTYKTPDNTYVFTPFTPRTPGIVPITGTAPIISVDVYVKATKSPKIAYYGLSRSDYGVVSNFTAMVDNSTKFIEGTYPIAPIAAMDKDLTYKTISGAKVEKAHPHTKGMATDALEAAIRASTLMGGNAIGLAIGPSNPGLPDYFEYHYQSNAAGVCFGQNTNGVIVLDGYYTGFAHEIGHLYGLYWGTLEQYETNPSFGLPASGVVSEDNPCSWIEGNCFMGIGAQGSLNENWVSNQVFHNLFVKMRVNTNDPEVIFVDGIINKKKKKKKVEIPFEWVVMPEGTPNIIAPGKYALNFIDHQGDPCDKAINFDAQFHVHIDPSRETKEKHGISRTIETDYAPFAFTVILPNGTERIQLIDNTTPDKPIILKELKTPPRINSIIVPKKSIKIGTEIKVSATFQRLDKHDLKATWDWGDEKSSTGTISDAGEVAGSHTYETTGKYTISLYLSNGEITYLSKFKNVKID